MTLLGTLSRIASAVCSLAVLAAWCSCGGSSGPGLRGQLSGRTFLLDSAQGFTPVAQTTVRLSFEEAQIRFSAGCNSFSGSYSLCGDALCVQALGSTEIGCAAQLQAQDQWLADFLTARPGLSLDSVQLTLSGADATLAFLEREVADPDRALTGRVWNIDTLIDGDSASNIPLPVSPTVSFDDVGSVQIFTSCNRGAGSYTRQADQLRFSGIVYSQQPCSSSSSAAAEAHIQRVLSDGTLTAQIEASRLTLTRDDVGLSATTE